MTDQEPISINADFSIPVVVDSTALPWLPSPQVGVERRMLERVGGEVARATSIVRYAAGSTFPAHEHGLGEEYLVLQGTFSDENGDYPSGTYVRNPPGSRHAPFAREGCTIFVKLRQMHDVGEPHLTIETRNEAFQSTPAPGLTRLPLFEPKAWSERVAIEKLAAGTTIPNYKCDGGEEILVLEGAVSDGTNTFGAGVWLRFPHGARHGFRSNTGAVLWVKRGHLAAET